MVLARARGVQKELRASWGLAETGQTGPTFIKIKKIEGPYAAAGEGVERSNQGYGIALFGVSGEGTEKTLKVTTQAQSRSANMVDFAKGALRLLEECVLNSDCISSTASKL